MRFSKPYVWEYRLGVLRNPRTALADVVAAFPPKPSEDQSS
jgi:hypothetical protein